MPYVVIGHGPTAVMIVAQQHGDEMETSDSAVNLVRTLSNNSMESKTIRAALKVIVVPRVNVDGFDGDNADGTPLTDATGTAVPPWRQNWDPRFTVNPLPAFYQRGRGYDINRYHAFRPECPLDNPNYPNITTVAASQLRDGRHRHAPGQHLRPVDRATRCPKQRTSAASTTSTSRWSCSTCTTRARASTTARW